MGSWLDLAPPSPEARVHGSQCRVEYPGTLSHLTVRGNDQQTIVHDKTDRMDFLTGLGQEMLPQRWRSAKSSNDPTLAPAFLISSLLFLSHEGVYLTQTFRTE